MYMILPIWVNPAGVSERVVLAVTIHQCQIGTWVKWPICSLCRRSASRWKQVLCPPEQRWWIREPDPA
jgi:hypothetical protein